MTRISRIRAPRATITAVALLLVAMLGFGILAEAGVGEAELAVRDAATVPGPSAAARLADVLGFCRS